VLYFTSNNAGLRNLLAYDLESGDTRTLLEGARIGDIAYNPADRSLWGLRTNNGFVMIVRVPYPYTEWQTLHVYPTARSRSTSTSRRMESSSLCRWPARTASVPACR